jgi:hypothetical protein
MMISERTNIVALFLVDECSRHKHKMDFKTLQTRLKAAGKTCLNAATGVREKLRMQQPEKRSRINIACFK